MNGPGLRKSTYAGLFFITLATLMYEILLPRIFSVTMFYHFAFMAVSLAMFGMTVGAVIVYLRAERYTEASATRDMAQNSMAFAVSSVVCLYIYLQIPILGSEETKVFPLIGISYVLIAIPFVFSGITLAIALTRFPPFVGKLYAVDLIGAATGAIAIVLVLDRTDALTTAVVIAALIAIGAAAFALGTPRGRFRTGMIAGAVLLSAAAIGHHFLAQSGKPVIKLTHRPFPMIPRLYERWNSFSYVEVLPSYVAAKGIALGWGMSSTLPPEIAVDQYPMDIDIKAGTAITKWNGDRKSLEFLRYDITNAVHTVKTDADICVIGVGGGRDILSALYHEQRSVLGIELNPNVLGTLTGPFADYTGRLHERPNVKLEVGEARSFLARSDARCDVIQISLIDTFAATAAGAFVLAENSLYTIEAWDLFLRRLKPGGILTVSRYYYHQRPSESYRMLSLAVAALEKNGITDYRQHLVMLKNETSIMVASSGIGTLLLSKGAWARADLERLSAYADSMKFQVVLSPDHAADSVIETVANGRDLPAFYRQYEIDISPPTDDRPFFFQVLRLRDILSTSVFDVHDVNWKNAKAILILAALLVIVIVLTAGCIVVPLIRTKNRGSLRPGAPLLAFFGAIGLGFIFIEMAQMQRLMVFLGNPTYALSVILFTLLLASGIGSFIADGLMRRHSPSKLRLVFAALLLLVTIVGVVSPPLMIRYEHVQTAGRIAIAIALVFPIGILMGMPFPLGMRRADSLAPTITPWLWGINGAASVCASVLAVVVALSLGIGASYWIGLMCYVVAAAIYALSADKPTPATA